MRYKPFMGSKHGCFGHLPWPMDGEHEHSLQKTTFAMSWRAVVRDNAALTIEWPHFQQLHARTKKQVAAPSFKVGFESVSTGEC